MRKCGKAVTNVLFIEKRSVKAYCKKTFNALLKKAKTQHPIIPSEQWRNFAWRCWRAERARRSLLATLWPLLFLEEKHAEVERLLFYASVLLHGGHELSLLLQLSSRWSYRSFLSEGKDGAKIGC